MDLLTNDVHMHSRDMDLRKACIHQHAFTEITRYLPAWICYLVWIYDDLEARQLNGDQTEDAAKLG